MKPKINVISLPVRDLEKSLTFYRDGLGLPTPGINEGIIAVELDGGLSLFLIERDQFASFSTLAQAEPHISHSSVECIFSCAVDSKEEVDTILEGALNTGGSIPSPAKEEAWGYTGYFKDPDGHLWEIVCPKNRAD